MAFEIDVLPSHRPFCKADGSTVAACDTKPRQEIIFKWTSIESSRSPQTIFLKFGKADYIQNMGFTAT
ncbi:hypothetical protein GX48_04964 [Paracoccidioides brasiliensis]|nr:hypothetical protein GX48_04964 [Paracoccidioides brasiliensis]